MHRTCNKSEGRTHDRGGKQARTCGERPEPGSVECLCGHAEGTGEKRERGGGGRERSRGDLDEVRPEALGETDQVVLVHCGRQAWGGGDERGVRQGRTFTCSHVCVQCNTRVPAKALIQTPKLWSTWWTPRRAKPPVVNESSRASR